MSTMRTTSTFLPFAALAALAVAACTGPEGPRGEQGLPGPTAPPPAGDEFQIALASATVGSSGTVYVEFDLTDEDGVARPLTGITASWTLAALTAGPGGSVWSSYITRPANGDFGATDQPASDTGGAMTYLGGARYRYTYGTPLTPGFDAAATHRIGVYARRPTEGENEVENEILDFVPNGGPADTREIVEVDNCNGCHAPLSAHGGNRRKVELCVTCHTPQLFDPDTEDPRTTGLMNPLEMRVMVHRIHEGKHLPSLLAAQAAGIVGAKYSVIGFQGNEFVVGETIADNMDADLLPQLTGIGFPQEDRNCVRCHTGVDSVRSRTTVDRAVCGSCHDTIWFGDPLATPPLHVAHPGDPMADDTLCATCHIPEGADFDLSITGAHVIPTRSGQLRGLQLSIVSAAVVGTGVQVVFTVKNGDDLSPVNPLTGLTSLSVGVNGPTSDYGLANLYRSPDLRSISSYDMGTGQYTVTLPARGITDPYFPSGPVIPFGSVGTFVAGMEGRRSVTLAGWPTPVTEPPDSNPVAYFSVDGSAAVPRRKIVDQEKCGSCHESLSLHGGQRRDVEYCVLCHNPENSDWSRRPKIGGLVNYAGTQDGIEERTIDFKRMIHRIHTGEELQETVPYAIYGFGSSINLFDEVRFPGDRSRCVTCHLPDAYLVESVPLDALPTLANESGTNLHNPNSIAHTAGEPLIPPVQAACTGCHDTVGARVHAELNTNAQGEESCIVCHGEGREFSVTSMHEGE